MTTAALLDLATHEAGHAAAAKCLGIEVKSVRLDRTEGEVKIVGDVDRVEEWIQVAMAGSMCIGRELDLLTTNPTGDTAVVLQLASVFGLGFADLFRLEARARTLIRTPEFRAALDEACDLLLEVADW